MQPTPKGFPIPQTPAGAASKRAQPSHHACSASESRRQRQLSRQPERPKRQPKWCRQLRTTTAAGGARRKVTRRLSHGRRSHGGRGATSDQAVGASMLGRGSRRSSPRSADPDAGAGAPDSGPRAPRGPRQVHDLRRAPVREATSGPQAAMPWEVDDQAPHDAAQHHQQRQQGQQAPHAGGAKVRQQQQPQGHPQAAHHRCGTHSQQGDGSAATAQAAEVEGEPRLRESRFGTPSKPWTPCGQPGSRPRSLPSHRGWSRWPRRAPVMKSSAAPGSLRSSWMP